MAKPVLAVDIDGIVCEFNNAFMNAASAMVREKHLNGDGGACRSVRNWVIAYGEETPARMHSNYESYAQMWDERYLCPKDWNWFGDLFGEDFNRAVWGYVEETEFWRHREVYPEWQQFLLNLKNQYIITFVTSRRGLESTITQTHAWLEDVGFPESDVIFSIDGRKGWAVAAIGAVGFVDDHYKNCVDVLRVNGTKCKVLVKDWFYNRNNGNRWSNETPYIHRVFEFSDFTKALDLDPELIPEGVAEYGRNAKRQWQGATTLNSPRVLGRNSESIYEWDDEVREEQLAGGDGVVPVRGRNGEASGEVVGGGGTGGRLTSPPHRARSSESNDVVAVDPIEGGDRQSAIVDRDSIVLRETGFTAEEQREYVMPLEPNDWSLAPTDERFYVSSQEGVPYICLRREYAERNNLLYGSLPRYE